MVKDQRGVTLIETLVALFVIAILVVSFASAFSSSLISIESWGNYYEALATAQNLLERAVAGEPLGEQDGIFTKRGVQWPDDVVSVPGTVITARVNYKTRFGLKGTVELSSFVAD